MKQPWKRISIIAFACVLLTGLRVSAAELSWVEDLGGRVTLNDAGDVTAIDLRGSWVTDTDLREIAKLPHLRYLDLSLTRVTDQGMQELKSAPRIEELNLRFAELVTDEGVAAVRNWKHLRRLNLRGTKVTDNSLEHVTGVSTLEALDVGSSQITDVGIFRLAALLNLKELTLGGNELTDTGMQALRQLPNLEYLDLSGGQGTDSNLWSISMTDVGFEAILTLKNLRELRLGCAGMGVGNEGDRYATVFPMKITTRWLERMESLPNLQKLRLQGCSQIGDESVAALTGLPSLAEVDLKGTTVSDEGVERLMATKPKVQVYHGPWDVKLSGFRNN